MSAGINQALSSIQGSATAALTADVNNIAAAASYDLNTVVGWANTASNAISNLLSRAWNTVQSWAPTGDWGASLAGLAPLAAIGTGMKALGLAEDVAEDGFSVAGRVTSLQDAIPAAQQGRITMAVGLAEDSNGVQQVIIGTSEPMGYLRPGVTLDPGEILAPGLGHAEADIVNFAQQNGLNLLEVGATRPICPGCASLIKGAGATPVTPLK